MCFPKQKAPTITPGAQPAPAPSAGAQALILGPSANNNDDEQLRNLGVLGRLALMVGRSGAGSAAPGNAGGGSSGVGGGGGGGSGIGSVGSGTGGSSSSGGSSSGSTSGGGSTSSSGGDKVGVVGGGRGVNVNAQ